MKQILRGELYQIESPGETFTGETRSEIVISDLVKWVK